MSIDLTDQVRSQQEQGHTAAKRSRIPLVLWTTCLALFLVVGAIATPQLTPTRFLGFIARNGSPSIRNWAVQRLIKKGKSGVVEICQVIDSLELLQTFHYIEMIKTAAPQYFQRKDWIPQYLTAMEQCSETLMPKELILTVFSEPLKYDTTDNPKDRDQQYRDRILKLFLKDQLDLSPVRIPELQAYFQSNGQELSASNWFKVLNAKAFDAEFEHDFANIIDHKPTRHKNLILAFSRTFTPALPREFSLWTKLIDQAPKYSIEDKLEKERLQRNFEFLKPKTIKKPDFLISGSATAKTRQMLKASRLLQAISHFLYYSYYAKDLEKKCLFATRLFLTTNLLHSELLTSSQLTDILDDSPAFYEEDNPQLSTCSRRKSFKIIYTCFQRLDWQYSNSLIIAQEQKNHNIAKLIEDKRQRLRKTFRSFYESETDYFFEECQLIFESGYKQQDNELIKLLYLPILSPQVLKRYLTLAPFVSPAKSFNSEKFQLAVSLITSKRTTLNQSFANYDESVTMLELLGNSNLVDSFQENEEALSSQDILDRAVVDFGLSKFKDLSAAQQARLHKCISDKKIREAFTQLKNALAQPKLKLHPDQIKKIYDIKPSIANLSLATFNDLFNIVKHSQENESKRIRQQLIKSLKDTIKNNTGVSQTEFFMSHLSSKRYEINLNLLANLNSQIKDKEIIAWVLEFSPNFGIDWQSWNFKNPCVELLIRSQLDRSSKQELLKRRICENEEDITLQPKIPIHWFGNEAQQQQLLELRK